ncbi:MAG: ribosome assembly RNA-binding protein YhbY [Acidibacillus sp.]|uniref:RNA-binding protein YhbY n=1 Tax=Sulfoacidibacillus ferrooxidans TaxID=2005001 RepID=A0A9X2AD50_9BACL|nr:ribosome assembly RNA-binding protein YhbY [Sulfoacidibacillus ferrooxidans]MCI0181917.1 RNA-binding protein YhbY [Sulfoacidibacillus ferrooxidans]MCY0892787.1 ribosome assembly RNA-binding protein YhbY [Acidibacillus sp.]
MTLTGKQARYLRTLAHPLQPVMQIGKGGMTDQVLDQIGLALEARELIKISVLSNSPLSVQEAAQAVQEGTKAEIVQTIGRIMIVYRRSQDHRTIVLPR